ncbi:triphosphoribosyl-dephospho-CoA synthase [Caballeronia sordidicola]|uniref:Probable 2-(5''-triphosphoribosyl)-3'-dephosphocoenzyme-A synthase n=1 Tax=Caballeronia sordidicola TaxID=196367 RepID=A0A226WQ50_CABSO|nr:triphosphoribosyl-dephospho-CoA synthase [Caballeronia sordidicola]OXC72887.1 Triphosphoribosyl-dephospho-CoA synthetase [Caballeronia sordidicola]
MACTQPVSIDPACAPSTLADIAVAALIDEACLTPKPALVDRRGSGAHRDLDLDTMLRSARSLRPTFLALARAAADQEPSQRLREQLARIGREGEVAMLRATNGSNAHRGAIWIVGLLCAAAAMSPLALEEPSELCAQAAVIARFDDRFAPSPAALSNGARVVQRFGVAGARGQAAEGFPHVLEAGLPALHRSRANGATEDEARLDALLAIIATLDDTCLLHRGGQVALEAAQTGAREALQAGGAARPQGRVALARLDQRLTELNASPGGAADLLAATLFLDTLPRVG